MEYLKLCNTDLTVSRFCMGGCPMGGYNWGETREEDFIDAIHAALDSGVNFFDTADTYGLGQSEKTLARGLGAHRKDVVIQSKFGVRVGDGKTHIDNSPEYLREALDNSLRRLGTDYIDIYVIHYWDQKTPPEAIVEELRRQKAAGKIRYFGISNIRPDGLLLFKPYQGEFATSQHEFSLCCRSWEAEIRQTVSAMNVTPMTWGSLGQGMLSGKYDEHSVFGDNDRRSRSIYTNFHGEKLKHNMKIVEELRRAAAHHGKSCSAVAVRFILDFFPKGVPIVGIKTAKQLLDVISAQGWHLDWEVLSRLNRISHADGSRATVPPWQKEF